MGDVYELPENTHISIDENGKYLWRGTINPRENPTIGLLFAKIIGLILGISALIAVGIGLLSGLNASSWPAYLAIVGGVMLVVAGISAIITLIYLRVLGDSYSADYAMDETGLVFRPAPREKQINRDVAIGTAVVSLLTGNLGLTVASIAAMDNDAANTFKSVRRVKGIKKHCCIKVSQLFLYNQVYVAPEDYDFVYHFISSHCPKARCHEV